MCLTSVPLEETIWLLTDKAFTNNWFNETYQLNLSRQDLVDLLTATKDQLFIFNGQLFEQTLSLWDPHLALYLLMCLCIALKKDWSKKARCPHTTGDLLMTHWPLCQHYNLCCTWSVWRITAWSRLVVTMATLGGIQSESSKDNRAIVLAGHMTWFAWSTSAFWHVTSNSQSKSSKGHMTPGPWCACADPPTVPQITGSDMTARPEVNEIPHYIGDKSYSIGFMRPRKPCPSYIRDIYNVLVTSRPPLFTSPIRVLLPPQFSHNHKDE